MLDLVKICHHKQFLFMHDNVDDLIESVFDSKLLSINFINSQRLDKKEQEVKIVEKQPAECRNRIEKSLQNFRVVHKSSISLNTSQISLIHEVTPILSTKEPKNSLSMGYEHLSITPEMESDEVTESNAKNLLPNPSECKKKKMLFNEKRKSFEDSPLISRPPSEPPDVESFFDLKPNVIAEEISDNLNEDKCFDPGREINVSTKIEDDDYFPFKFRSLEV
nr:hypothetical protein [Tanacetum cinerariifolium]